MIYLFSVSVVANPMSAGSLEANPESAVVTGYDTATSRPNFALLWSSLLNIASKLTFARDWANLAPKARAPPAQPTPPEVQSFPDVCDDFDDIFDQPQAFDGSVVRFKRKASIALSPENDDDHKPTVIAKPMELTPKKLRRQNVVHEYFPCGGV